MRRSNTLIYTQPRINTLNPDINNSKIISIPKIFSFSGHIQFHPVVFYFSSSVEQYTLSEKLHDTKSFIVLDSFFYISSIT